MFGILEIAIVKFSSKSEEKTISHNFFNYKGAWPPYKPVFIRDFIPTPFTGASALRPCMNDNRLKLKSTGSRVLLLMAFESGSISEFLTFFCPDFDINF